MPIIFSQRIDGVALYVWKMEESLEDIEQSLHLSGDELHPLQTIRLEKRKMEWLAVRKLFQVAAIDPSDVYHLANGKPMLRGNRFLSISHDGDLACLAVSELRVGIDLQGVHPKLSVIKSKFCSESEQDLALHFRHESIALALIWSAKEAVFKFYGERVDFKADLSVTCIDLDSYDVTLNYTGVHGQKVFLVTCIAIADRFLMIAR